MGAVFFFVGHPSCPFRCFNKKQMPNALHGPPVPGNGKQRVTQGAAEILGIHLRLQNGAKFAHFGRISPHTKTGSYLRLRGSNPIARAPTPLETPPFCGVAPQIGRLDPRPAETESLFFDGGTRRSDPLLLVAWPAVPCHPRRQPIKPSTRAMTPGLPRVSSGGPAGPPPAGAPGGGGVRAPPLPNPHSHSTKWETESSPSPVKSGLLRLQTRSAGVGGVDNWRLHR